MSEELKMFVKTLCNGDDMYFYIHSISYGVKQSRHIHYTYLTSGITPNELNEIFERIGGWE